MTMKKFLAALFALTVVFALACGGGKEASKDEEGEDDGAEVATATTATGGTAAPAAAAPAAVSADAAQVAGMVKLEGAHPAQPPIQMSADPYCQSQHSAPVPAQDVTVAADGSLANVFVYIKDIQGTFTPPATDAVLDQHGCQYYPHVSGLQVGQKLQIKNSDSTLHNVHCMATKNPEFNVGQPVANMSSEKTFDNAEVMVKFKCDVHSWMNSYVGVLPHPFFGVSGANGQFTIANLPPGTYTLVAWHQKFGTQEQQITVGAKESKQVTFSFKAS
jgi:plastocyanin